MGEGCLRAGGRSRCRRCLRAGGRVPASESACEQGPYSRGRLCLRAGTVYTSESAYGQGLRTGAHLRCFPSRRCAAGPSRSRSHGRLRRPKSLPIRHSPVAAQCLTPLGWRDCSCFDLLATSIRKSGPEIKNRCTVLPEIGPKAASIRKSWPEIKNHCTISPKNGPAAAAIRKSWPEIKNRCSAIVPAK